MWHRAHAQHCSLLTSSQSEILARRLSSSSSQYCSLQHDSREDDSKTINSRVCACVSHLSFSFFFFLLVCRPSPTAFRNKTAQVLGLQRKQNSKGPLTSQASPLEPSTCTWHCVYRAAPERPHCPLRRKMRQRVRAPPRWLWPAGTAVAPTLACTARLGH